MVVVIVVAVVVIVIVIVIVVLLILSFSQLFHLDLHRNFGDESIKLFSSTLLSLLLIIMTSIFF